MAGEVIKIDTDVVMANYTRVAQLIADLDSRVNRFISIVNEQNQSTGGKFSILNTLATRIATEADNLKRINEKVDDIRVILDKFIERAAEANDDSALNALADM